MARSRSDIVRGAHVAPKGRRPLLWLGGFLGGIVVLVALVGVGYVLLLDQTVDSNLTRVDEAFPDESTRPARAGSGVAADEDEVAEGDLPDGPVNFLLMGSDARASGSPEAEQVTGQRSDVMMLAHLTEERDHVYVVSFPRDSWVDIPGRGQAKINAGLAFGGFPLAVQTVEQLTDARVDHVALIEFEGFKEMTDALGGVEVEVSQAFTSRSDGRQFSPGLQHVDGEAALELVRERYQVSGGDFGRINHQHEFLRAMLDKAVSRGTLTDPRRLNAFIDTSTRHMTVDDGISSSYLRSLALSMRNLRDDDVTFITAPIRGLDRSSDGQSIVVLDDARMADLRDALRNGSFDAYLAAEQGEDSVVEVEDPADAADAEEPTDPDEGPASQAAPEAEPPAEG